MIKNRFTGLNIYSKKQRWKLLIFIAAITIGILSLWFTNKLVKKLSNEERKRVELWAYAVNEVANDDNPNQDVDLILKVITNNTLIPAIHVNEKDSILSIVNLDSTRINDSKYLREQLRIMKSEHDPIIIVISKNIKQYVYYKDSILLTQLFYYPYIQLGIIFLFIVIAYLAFSTSRKAEQNQVWVGMSKETAHQLGTPISSLIGWIELLKMRQTDEEIVNEIDKDIKRLETIAERFSKIGSAPVLSKVNIIETLVKSINYLQLRTSVKIIYRKHFEDTDVLMVPVNVALFEWVIENVCKNSVDAMNGSGVIDIKIIDCSQVLYIDIKDNGKGLTKSKYKTIFHPGYTTKQKGWGLGLSLSKRIIEEYHSGKIFVKNSEINVGTTIRIVLKK